jgi:PncC family amidohydrolase
LDRIFSSEPLEARVGALLLRRGLTLAVAESATGGLVLHRLTNVSGSSAYVLGGVVAYANEAKEGLLAVRRETLVAHGAVSAETAIEMARGVRRALTADIGLSTTGIAGPTGATPNKPVGLVHIALAASDREAAIHLVADGDRLHNKECFAQAALELLLSYLEGRP